MWHAAPCVSGRRNQAAHDMLHTAFPSMAGTICPLTQSGSLPHQTAQAEGSRCSLTSNVGESSVHAGRVPGSLDSLWLRTEGWRAFCWAGFAGKLFFSKGVKTPTKALCDLSQAALSFGQAEQAQLKGEQMCRACYTNTARWCSSNCWQLSNFSTFGWKMSF